ncbi:hypothetical protein BH09MYX1_BH09MYX1_46310 [soil metagenome]
MTETNYDGLHFNALTDAWLPLVQKDGATVWASPVEVLCGEKDGVDLDYPRDDFRVYARLLLSALVQALFAAKTKSELLARLETPLSRAQVEARIKPVLTEFDMFGPTPFLQVVPPANPPHQGAAPFVFRGEDLFQPATPIRAISIPAALVMLFAEEAYAGGAGRGYGAGPGGQPGALTVIDPGSVRSAAWANTLTLELAATLYAPDGDRPWSNEKQDAKPRAAIGLVAGLFFQSRAAWLIAGGDGLCSFNGMRGPLVRCSPLLPKSALASKPSAGEDLWQHPCAPLAMNSQGIGAVRLNAARPAWTGLAQLLRPLSKDSKKSHPRQGPAPVLEQWKKLGLKAKSPRLLVLDFDRDKANVRRRFFEAFPLTEHLLGNADAIERLRLLVTDAQDVRFALVRALTSAHDDRKQGGLALADAETAFWTASEAPFFDWLDEVVADDGTDAGGLRIDAARQTMTGGLRRVALAMFDEHVSISEFDPRKQARVANARRSLTRTLYPKPRPATPAPTHSPEVHP